jgi:hypothetical protein
VRKELFSGIASPSMVARVMDHFKCKRLAMEAAGMCNLKTILNTTPDTGCDPQGQQQLQASLAPALDCSTRLFATSNGTLQ